MWYSTLVKNRLNTTNSLRHSYWGYQPIHNVYFANDPHLLTAIEMTERRLLATAQNMVEEELRLWRKVLRSNSTTAAGLRSVIARIRGLCKELDREDEKLEADLALFVRRVNRARCREYIEHEVAELKETICRPWARYAPHPERLRYCDQYLKQRGHTYRSVGKKRQEVAHLITQAMKAVEQERRKHRDST